MSPIIDFSNGWNVLVALILFVLALVLAKLTNKSTIIGFTLGVFLVLTICHAIEYVYLDKSIIVVKNILSKCLTYDFIFIGLSFISYLWLDDIEAKLNKRKSIDNSLEWFWKKV